MMKKLILAFFSALLLGACNNRSNLELAIDFKASQTNGTLETFSRALNDEAIFIYGDTLDTLSKEDMILNYEFSKPFEHWSRITDSAILNDSVVSLRVLESNLLNSLFGLDSVEYLYTYRFSNSKISEIRINQIPNSSYNYQEEDSLYNLKLNELIDWIYYAHPDKFEKLELMDKAAAEVLMEMAKEVYKYDR